MLIGEHTTAAAAYVAMTRGRDNNVAHLVADTTDDARRQWIELFGRDRADLGPAHAAHRAANDIERYGPAARPRPLSGFGVAPWYGSPTHQHQLQEEAHGQSPRAIGPSPGR